MHGSQSAAAAARNSRVEYPAAVLAFIVSMSERFCPSSMRTVGTALRSFFAYLRVDGLCEKPLEAAIPRVACWRLSTLPKALSEEQLQRVLASLAASSPYALRDRAIVLCLATLGLRPREIADLAIDDIDWGAGVVQLDGRKTRRGGLLPLPREAGRAIVAYLRQGRPTTDERRLFVQHRGPRCGQRLSANAVSEVVARALRRAGFRAPGGGRGVAALHRLGDRREDTGPDASTAEPGREWRWRTCG